MDSADATRFITEKARELGFDLCGVAPVAEFPELAHRNGWLARGYAGEMRYLDDSRRASPAAAMPEARSIIVCALNYNTPLAYSTEAAAGASQGARGWISRYAWGDDYHDILRERLDTLIAAMRAHFIAKPGEEAGASFVARPYVDTGPVHERLAAKYAGLGWIGKNTLLLNESLGSWLFLGVILTSLELQPSLAGDSAQASQWGEVATRHWPLATSPDLCGQCTQCIHACPTGAIVEAYVLDARRCISYLTIEHRSVVPEEFRAGLGWHVFGCDICQDVCPYNRHAPVTNEARFQPREIEVGGGESEGGRKEAGSRPEVRGLSLHTPGLEWLLELTEEEFAEMFRGSAVRRTKWRGLMRNALYALGNWLAAGGSSREEIAGENELGAVQPQPPPAEVATAPSSASPAKSAKMAGARKAEILLEAWTHHHDPALADAARWALGRLPARSAAGS